MREPTVNATMEPDLSHIVYHDYVDISVAVATPKGLVRRLIVSSDFELESIFRLLWAGGAGAERMREQVHSAAGAGDGLIRHARAQERAVIG